MSTHVYFVCVSQGSRSIFDRVMTVLWSGMVPCRTRSNTFFEEGKVQSCGPDIQVQLPAFAGVWTQTPARSSPGITGFQDLQQHKCICKRTNKQKTGTKTRLKSIGFWWHTTISPSHSHLFSKMSANWELWMLSCYNYLTSPLSYGPNTVLHSLQWPFFFKSKKTNQ